jgi:hypothetical protein
MLPSLSQKTELALAPTAASPEQDASVALSRLLTKDCRNEVQTAEKSEGPGAIKFAIWTNIYYVRAYFNGFGDFKVCIIASGIFGKCLSLQSIA